MLFSRSFLAAFAVATALTGAAVSSGNRANALDDGTPIPADWSATGTFTRLSAQGPDNVRFTTGDRWLVRAEGDRRTLDRLRFVLENGRLVVGRRSGDDAALPAATIYVTAPSLSQATLAGSGVLDVDRLSGEAIAATVAGSGDLNVASLSAKSLKATVAGSGELSVAGHTSTAQLTVAGSGSFAGGSFSTDRADATIAGSGDVAFHSDGEVAARISGSGSVDVTGRATCSQSRSGSGVLRCGV